jgi:hypothetical protein
MTLYLEPPPSGPPSPVSRITDLSNAGFGRTCHVILKGCDATLEPSRDSPSRSTRRSPIGTPDVVSLPTANAKSSVSDVDFGENPQWRFGPEGELNFSPDGSPRARRCSSKPRRNRCSDNPAEIASNAGRLPAEGAATAGVREPESCQAQYCVTFVIEPIGAVRGAGGQNAKPPALPGVTPFG